MKKLLTLLSGFCLPLLVAAQTDGVQIDYAGVPPARNNSAIFELNSTGQGFLVPRINDATIIISPATGLLVYQTSGTAGFYYWTGAAWVMIGNTTTGTPPTGAAGGDLTGTYPNPTIASGAVNGGVGGDILDNSISTDDILNGTIATGDISNNVIDGTKIGIGTTNGDIIYYDGTDWLRLGAGASGTVLRSNGVAAPSWVNLVGSGLGDNLGNHTATTTLNMVVNTISRINNLDRNSVCPDPTFPII